MTFNKPAQPADDDAADHPTMPADERGRRSQPADNDRVRWLELADSALRRAPSEEDVAETEALARKEQEKIKRRIRPTAEKVNRHSKSKQ
jgi:gluconate kinase